jgi:hypothetical protein
MIVIIIGILLLAIAGIAFFMLQKKATDCKVTEWSQWTPCSKNCDGGVKTRTRTILTNPANGGKICPSLIDTSTCNPQPCPTDCSGAWTEWSQCSVSCGSGTKERTFKVSRAAANGGQQCSANDNTIQQEVCNTMIPCRYPTFIEPEVIVFDKIRIHNTFYGSFYFVYDNIDINNQTQIKLIVDKLLTKKKMKINAIHNLNNTPEDLTDINNTPVPELEITNVITDPVNQYGSIYVTVQYNPKIRLREHKLISFST